MAMSLLEQMLNRYSLTTTEQLKALGLEVDITIKQKTATGSQAGRAVLILEKYA